MLIKLQTSITKVPSIILESDVIFVRMVKIPGFLSMIMATSQNMRTVIELHRQIGNNIKFIRLLESPGVLTKITLVNRQQDIVHEC